MTFERRKSTALGKGKNVWPNIYSRTHRTGSKSWVVDLGLLNGKRERRSFKTKDHAEVFAEQARIKRQNEGLAAFNLSTEIRMDAWRAIELIRPHGVTLHEAALDFTKSLDLLKACNVTLIQAAEQYAKTQSVLQPHGVSLDEVIRHYESHVLKYRNSPKISSIIEQIIQDAESNKRRSRTVDDLSHRLRAFAEDFGDRKLTDLHVQEIKEWVADDGWAPQTRINYLTKLSQLFNYGIRHGWAEVNPVSRIDRPDVEDGEPRIFTVDEAKRLLENSTKHGLRAYIAIGLFAGLRSAELFRLKGDAIREKEKVIIVGADVAKKRSRRVVEMSSSLICWLKSILPIQGPIVDAIKFRERMEELRKAAGIAEWPHNGLRHSFGSYHLAWHGDQVKTANQMGHRDASVVHNHYKALVLKKQAKQFWSLKP